MPEAYDSTVCRPPTMIANEAQHSTAKEAACREQRSRAPRGRGPKSNERDYCAHARDATGLASTRAAVSLQEPTAIARNTNKSAGAAAINPATKESPQQ